MICSLVGRSTVGQTAFPFCYGSSIRQPGGFLLPVPILVATARLPAYLLAAALGKMYQ